MTKIVTFAQSIDGLSRNSFADIQRVCWRWLELEEVATVSLLPRSSCCKVISSCHPTPSNRYSNHPLFLFFPYEAKLRSVSCCAAPAQSSFVSIILCAENTENTKVCRGREYREYKGEICPAARRKNCPTLIVREASRGPSLQSNMDYFLRVQDFLRERKIFG